MTEVQPKKSSVKIMMNSNLQDTNKSQNYNQKKIIKSLKIKDRF